MLPDGVPSSETELEGLVKGVRTDLMLLILPNGSLLSSIKISDLLSVLSRCVMRSLFHSINTSINKSNKLEKHLGKMPGEKPCQCSFASLMLLVNY